MAAGTEGHGVDVTVGRDVVELRATSGDRPALSHFPQRDPRSRIGGSEQCPVGTECHAVDLVAQLQWGTRTGAIIRLLKRDHPVDMAGRQRLSVGTDGDAVDLVAGGVGGW